MSGLVLIGCFESVRLLRPAPTLDENDENDENDDENELVFSANLVSRVGSGCLMSHRNRTFFAYEGRTNIQSARLLHSPRVTINQFLNL